MEQCKLSKLFDPEKPYISVLLFFNILVIIELQSKTNFTYNILSKFYDHQCSILIKTFIDKNSPH